MAGLYHEFLAHLKDTGVTKTANYQVSIPMVPGPVAVQYSGFNRLLAMRCEAAELPGRQLVTQDSKIYGPTYKTPYQSLYQEITLNFLEASDFFIRRFFEAWHNTIFDSTTNQLAYPNSYRTDILLTQYDMMFSGDSMKQIATWNLINAFPTGINQMPLAWSEDGLHRVAVTMAYEYYIITTPEKPSPPAARPPVQAPVSPQDSGSGED